MFTGQTKNLAVMGWPILHSLSPALQNAALQQAGLDYAYIALPVPPEELETAVKGLKAMNFRGWNVTIPHKSAIIPLLDEVDEPARIIGAVNTVVNTDGRLKGYNTDAAGFLRGLEEISFSPRGQIVTVLGAGGAARAVLWALLQSKTEKIVLAVRNPGKAEPLAAEFRKYGSIEVCHWEDASFRTHLKNTGLLINTTPLGMTPHVDCMPPVDLSLLPKDAPVYDIIYTPAKTKLLQEAEATGHPVINGEYMLAGQGAEGFRLWTGQNPDEGLMRKVLRESLMK